MNRFWEKTILKLQFIIFFAEIQNGILRMIHLCLSHTATSHRGNGGSMSEWLGRLSWDQEITDS